MNAARPEALEAAAEAPPPRTNRDLYEFVEGLAARYAGSERTLGEYLRALWFLGVRHRNAASLSFDDLTTLLEEAMRTAPPPFGAPWWVRMSKWTSAESPFCRWERTLIAQIVALQRMEETGVLEGTRRRGGVVAPARWHNFEPLAFLESAVAGTVGGWSPRELDEPVVTIERVSWPLFSEFLLAGQCHE